MAEIALLAALIPKLITLLNSEVSLLRNIRKDLESIKRELECMKDFLMVADGVEEESSENNVWLNQVRNVSYESEDIVDEFMLLVSRDQLETSGSSSTSCCCRISSMIRDGRAKHDLASRMQDIIVKFEGIRQSNGRYRTDQFKSSTNPSSAGRKWHNPQQDVLILSQDDLIGTEMHEKNLIHMLVNVTDDNKSASVVSVFGMGGVGKTSLVKKVYDNPEVMNHFLGRIWITVSRNFEDLYVLKELIRSVYRAEMGHEPKEKRKMHRRQQVEKILQSMSRIELYQRARELLAENMYLIVLDDVWSTDAWNSTMNVLMTTCWHCQVVITTRNRSTALAACRGQVSRIYELRPLSYDESLELFYTKIFGSSNSCPDQLVEVSQNILKKCAGLPLAIVAIAGVLVSKDATTQSDEWGRIDNSLQKAFEGIHRVLSVCYSDLPQELKPCFLYLSIFPEDHIIKKLRLVRLWIAEGFVGRKSGMAQEEVAESYLDELISRSLIQVVERTGDGKVDTFRIHDLLREVITMKAKNENFAALAWEYDHLEFLKMRRLSFSSVSGMVQHSRSPVQLRSLFIFSPQCPVNKKSTPALFFKDIRFKLLTVLDLEGTILNKFPPTIVKLMNLKYLNLSHTDVKEVPSSIGKLLKLETLDFRSTLVSELPKAILKLQHLRDLLIYRVENEEICGVRMPAGIEALRSLTNLCFIDAERYNGVAVEEIPQLRRFCITNLNKNNANDICSLVKYLKNLRVLSMSSAENEDWDMDLEHLVSPSDSLRALYLTGKLVCVPQWLETMHNLVTLYLQSSKLQDDPVKTLGRLPNLIHLELADAYTGAEMRVRAGNFLKLKKLGVHNFTWLEKMILENQALPNLETLIMENNKLMKMVPSGIENLSKLKELLFVEMAADLASSILGSSGQEGSEYEKIKHVPEVNWVYKDGNSWKIESLVISAGRNEELKRSRIIKASTMKRANILLADTLSGPL